MSIMKKLTPNLIFVLTFLAGSGLVGGGLYLAKTLNLAACPLCIIQRMLYLALALVLGVVERLLKPPLWLTTAIFVPATFAVCWLGTKISGAFVVSGKFWVIAILVYCAVASVLPVWTLLQPRGYLGGYVLYTALAVGLFGVLFGGYEIRQPFFRIRAHGPLVPFPISTSVRRRPICRSSSAGPRESSCWCAPPSKPPSRRLSPPERPLLWHGTLRRSGSAPTL